ncbi:ORF6N domain-containing protein [Opitutaceae bacterium]|nr:ORF6N domain-containing protein [Opitutaceae bacterium]
MPRKAQRRAPVSPPIHTVRKQSVVLDSDLAEMYGVETKRLNQAVRRNDSKFPLDFCFELTQQEFASLRSHNVTLKTGRGTHRKYLPLVFTEHGALMAATVLKSDQAVQMSLYLIKAFVQMRDEMLASKTILKRLAEMDRRLLEHDVVLQEMIARIQPLLDAPPVDDKKPKKARIGYHEGNR